MPFRIAIVGSGPAGFYAAGQLLAADLDVEVDLFERLPTPWGLVRLGVAPDHPNIKAVSRVFEKIAAKPGFRFLGNVEIGRDLSHDDLMRLYDGVVYSFGAQTDRRMGIPGEDLAGSWPATAFVAWYNGHPDFQDLEFDLGCERVVVVGNGNVAVDVARMLALTAEELTPTDTTDSAIAAICGARIREIVVLGRRGLVQRTRQDVEKKCSCRPSMEEQCQQIQAEGLLDGRRLRLESTVAQITGQETCARRDPAREDVFPRDLPSRQMR